MYANLYTAMKKAKVTQLELSKALSLSPKAVNNKLKGRSKFDSSEMIFIQERYFPDSDLKELFTED